MMGNVGAMGAMGMMGRRDGSVGGDVVPGVNLIMHVMSRLQPSISLGFAWKYVQVFCAELFFYRY